MEEGKDFALTAEKAEVPQYIELRFTDTLGWVVQFSSESVIFFSGLMGVIM